MFGWLKDWPRAASCYDRCMKIFLSALALATTVFSWLWNFMVLETMAFRMNNAWSTDRLYIKTDPIELGFAPRTL